LSHHITNGTITPIERTLEFTKHFSDKITDKTQHQRFLGSLNYVIDFYPNLNHQCKILYDILKKNPKLWSEEHTNLIKQQIKDIPCLRIVDYNASKIVETDASNIGYGGILKHVKNNKEKIIQFVSGH